MQSALMGNSLHQLCHPGESVKVIQLVRTSFLLCTEGLSSLLLHKENLGGLHGVRNGLSGPPISHLLFADDSMFFARSDFRSVEALKETLLNYCEGSGHRINLEKSSIFFGLRCGDQVKEDVMQRLGVNNESLQDTYLGSFTLLAPIPEGATVDFLLQDDHGAWDVDVVRAVFEEDVANQVLQIPISRRVGRILCHGPTLSLEITQSVLLTTWQDQKNSFWIAVCREEVQAPLQRMMPNYGRSFGQLGHRGK
jgi:hypothetical protein